MIAIVKQLSNQRLRRAITALVLNRLRFVVFFFVLERVHVLLVIQMKWLG